jgi:hypothetical protein
MSERCQILLQKSAATDWGLWPSLRAAALRSLTRFTQLHRYAITEPEWVVGEPSAVRAAAGSGQWQPERIHSGRLVDHGPSFRMRFKCANHIFALTSRLLKVFGASKRPGNVSGVFMDVARCLA